MDGEKLVPEIRFRGFEECWENKKLKDISDRITRKNTNLETSRPLTISAEYGLIDQQDYYDNRVASKNLDGYYLIRNGEFAYNKSYSTTAPYGAIKRLDNYEAGALSTLYILFKLKQQIDSDYMKSYFDSDAWHEELIKIAAEGARNHGLLNVPTNDFFEIKITKPKNQDEQSKIGQLFQQIDKIIDLQDKLVEENKRLKKSLLQKMFPKEGKTVPGIRFAGFEGDWEETYLKKIAKYTTGYTPSTEDSTNFSDDYVWYSISDFTEKYISDSKRKISEKAYRKDKLVVSGSLLMSFKLTIGELAFTTVDCLTNEAIVAFDIDEKKADAEFIYNRLITTNLEKFANQAAQGLTLNQQSLQDIKFLTPTLDEQTKIGSFFQTLDQKIQKEEEKLETYKKFKNSLLQKMFV